MVGLPPVLSIVIKGSSPSPPSIKGFRSRGLEWTTSGGYALQTYQMALLSTPDSTWNQQVAIWGDNHNLCLIATCARSFAPWKKTAN